MKYEKDNSFGYRGYFSAVRLGLFSFGGLFLLYALAMG